MKPKFYILAFSLLLCSCGEPPPIPPLPGHNPHPTDRVLLDDRLDAEDIRQIFKAVNADGKLDSLAPLLNSADDTQLKKLGGLMDRYLYSSAHHPDSLIGLLHQRARHKTFSQLLTRVKKNGRPQTSATLLRALWNAPSLVEVVERDIHWLSPKLDPVVEKLFPASEKKQSSEASLPAARELVRELTQMMGNSALEKRFNNLSAALFEGAAPLIGVAEALQHLEPDVGRSPTGSDLSKLIHTPQDSTKGGLPTQFDGLADLLRALDGSSNGLFTQIQSKLEAEPKLLSMLGDVFQPNAPEPFFGYLPLVPHAIYGLFLHQLKTDKRFDRAFWLSLTHPEKPSRLEAEKLLFIQARSAIQSVVGEPRDSGTDDYLLVNLPIYLNSFVLSRWVQGVASANRPLIEKIPASDFSTEIWKTPLAIPAITHDFLKEDLAENYVFDPVQLAELKAIGLEEFAELLGKLPVSGVGNFLYSFEGAESALFEVSLKQAFEATDKTRPFADGSALARSLILKLTQRGNDGESFLTRLETPNLLLSAHRFLSSLPLEALNRANAVGNQGLLDIASNPELVLQFYKENSPQAELASRILKPLATLSQWAGDSDKSSALKLYLHLVQETGPQEWKALIAALLTVVDSEVFSMKQLPDGKLVPVYPALQRWLLGSSSESSLIKRILSLTSEQMHLVNHSLSRMFGKKNGVSGSEMHWDLLKYLLTEHGDSVAQTLENLRFEGGARQGLSPAERQWLVAFVEEGAFGQVWDLAQELLQGPQAAGWVSELKQLSQEGTLKSTFQLLKRVRSDRMQAIAAVLLEWEESGELLAFLETLELFFGPPALANGPP